MLARDLAMATARSEVELGYPGISVFASASLGFLELVLTAPQLHVYAEVRRTTARALRQLGCELVPTGAVPDFTLPLPDAEFPTLARVRDVFGTPIPNPAAR